jgi:hypothetical protein
MLRNESAEPIDHDLPFLVPIQALSQHMAYRAAAGARPVAVAADPGAPGHAVVQDQLRYPAPGGQPPGRPASGAAELRRLLPRASGPVRGCGAGLRRGGAPRGWGEPQNG